MPGMEELSERRGARGYPMHYYLTKRQLGISLDGKFRTLPYPASPRTYIDDLAEKIGLLIDRVLSKEIILDRAAYTQLRDAVNNLRLKNLTKFTPLARPLDLLMESIPPEIDESVRIASPEARPPSPLILTFKSALERRRLNVRFTEKGEALIVPSAFSGSVEEGDYLRILHSTIFTLFSNIENYLLDYPTWIAFSEALGSLPEKPYEHLRAMARQIYTSSLLRDPPLPPFSC